ncbi:VC0807 family protein [Ectobacillus ponti]|uniref:DUF3159 domain-containing protein n=1 Tax=Ectobacillus ponti TaxID=2961894 RepID=A0AA41X6D6_9BACI|nr:VC0807 family protein [Ectobacillus ponti]MCP8969632.1 hypothetical protein [Ectobacillus ponti]
MQKRIAILDIVCYVVLPLVVWNLFRKPLGDYTAMLVTTVPGILYSVYRFKAEKRINFGGMFLLGNLIVTTLINILAGSALQMLWNNVFYLYGLGLFFLVSIFVKRPLFLYFALDVVELQGYDRKAVKAFFLEKKVYRLFVLITLVFALRDAGLAALKMQLIHQYGVDAFSKAIVLRQGLNWGMGIVAAIGMAYIFKLAEPAGVFAKSEEA